MNQLTIQTRLQAVKEAQTRTRLAFLASTIASLSVLIAGWNAYFSWTRAFMLSNEFSKNGFTEAIQRETIKELLEAQVISISLLGVHLRVDDFAVLGSVAMMVFSTWMFYCIRRENHNLGTLLRDTQSDALEVRQWVYYGIASSTVFTTITHQDRPIRDLSKGPVQEKSVLFLRPLLTVLWFLPALAIISIFAMDLYSLYAPTYYAIPHTPLRYAKSFNAVKFYLWETPLLVCGLPTIALCWKVKQFSQATSHVLKRYSTLLSLTPRQAPGRLEPTGTGGAQRSSMAVATAVGRPLEFRCPRRRRRRRRAQWRIAGPFEVVERVERMFRS